MRADTRCTDVPNMPRADGDTGIYSPKARVMALLLVPVLLAVSGAGRHAEVLERQGNRLYGVPAEPSGGSWGSVALYPTG